MVEQGQSLLRAEVVDKIIKQTAERSYKFKQALSIISTNAWNNVFWREDPDPLTEKTGNVTKGLPRGANFPQLSPTWTRITRYLEKYGAEENIFWEDTMSDEIDIQGRTLFKIAERVTKSVDDEIWEVLTEGNAVAGGTPANIGFLRIADLSEWDNAASAAIVDDLMQAKQKIAEKNYNVSNLMCFISPKDHRSIVNYVHTKGAQYASFGEQAAKNGNVGKLAGINFILSNSVTASSALIVVPKVVGTWKANVALTTDVTIDPFKSTRIRAVEVGVTELHEPSAAFLIVNTVR